MPAGAVFLGAAAARPRRVLLPKRAPSPAPPRAPPKGLGVPLAGPRHEEPKREKMLIRPKMHQVEIQLTIEHETVHIGFN